MDLTSQFIEIKCKFPDMERYIYKGSNGYPDWELVFFDNRSTARLILGDDVRFKSVEFESEEELFNLFLHDPVFRVSVGLELFPETLSV
jgi:hypothetical protein